LFHDDLINKYNLLDHHITMLIVLNQYIARFSVLLQGHVNKLPWEITDNLPAIVESLISALGPDYELRDKVAIHKSAVIEQNVVIKGPAIIANNVTISANAYLRGPLLIDEWVHIGAGCEIKQSVIFSATAIAHFNYIGNSIVGSNVNFEAGSVAANHFNEREDKTIYVALDSGIVQTGTKKFGSLVGDGCRIGANAVLTPGTILKPLSIVQRLELVEQVNTR
jgi:UDP-N-acetylglucosamine diphosphorylase / glucose-1-phosphate thymidylyltransferase / UDP-N-acetylgalactosamine diphosphorylase / glucosamine-1-phosphate N-acetyltransferase / galactosamine-1-phosphate N-acetyltransferase